MRNTQYQKSSLLNFSLIAMVSSLAVSPVLADEHESPVLQDKFNGNVRLLFGQKQLDSDDWGSLDRQNEIGMIFDLKKPSWPVSIALDILFSGEDGNLPGTERGDTFEQHLGIRKVWDVDQSNFHPYLGGGIAFIQASAEKIGVATSVKDDDSSVGFWIGSGVDWYLSPKMNLGFDIRYSQADATIFSQDIKAGGLHTSVNIGYRW